MADTGRPDATHAVFHLNSTAFTHTARLIDHRAGHCERIHHEAVTGRGVEVVVELVVCRLNFGFGHAEDLFHKIIAAAFQGPADGTSVGISTEIRKCHAFFLAHRDSQRVGRVAETGFADTEES